MVTGADVIISPSTVLAETITVIVPDAVSLSVSFPYVGSAVGKLPFSVFAVTSHLMVVGSIFPFPVKL